MICLAVSTEYRRVTVDRRTDWYTSYDSIVRTSITSRGKNSVTSFFLTQRINDNVSKCAIKRSDRSLVHRTYISVSYGAHWKLSARSFGGVPADIAAELFANVTSRQGRRYELISTDDQSLTFLASTFTVLLNGPMSPSGVGMFEKSLENALRPLLGQSA